LRERPEDVHLLFRKFARDFAEKYRMPPIQLEEDAKILLVNFSWPGNVRQLKNITEQISIIEQNRDISADTLRTYLPDNTAKNLPALLSKQQEGSFSNEREILYKVLFDMKRDMTDLKKLVLDLMENKESPISGDQAQIIRNLYKTDNGNFASGETQAKHIHIEHVDKENIQDTEEYVEESLSLEDKEIELIKKALDKHKGKRKYAAQELGISERTLYRKIKEYDING
jgi:DNA-binding NtrC family response regulator